MNQQNHQSIIGAGNPEGVLKGITEGTFESALEDLCVQEAEAITGGHDSTTILVAGRSGLRLQEILR